LIATYHRREGSLQATVAVVPARFWVLKRRIRFYRTVTVPSISALESLLSGWP